MEQSKLLIERLLKHAKQWQETLCVWDLHAFPTLTEMAAQVL